MRNKIITVFGSAFTKPEETYYSEVEEIGKLLAQKGYSICSGGYAGIMEAVSKGAKSVKGKTIGITVVGWSAIPNQYLDEVVEMPNLMERIMELITISDGYIVLKGGTGTLTELAVTLELMNKKSIPEKPIFVYKGFWKNVLETLKLDSEKLSALIEKNIIYFDEPEKISLFLK
jgi:hypothetical protein